MVEFGFATEGGAIVKAFSDQLKGRTFLITGPSEGSIGAETATTLAHGSPSTFLFLGRSISKIKPVIDQVSAIDPSITVKFFQVDLDSISSVRGAAKSILEDCFISKIDVMVNNAGIMAAPYGKTADGLEMQFGVNYMSHFLLTNLLMPKILAAGPGARIVNISSYGNIMSNILYDDVGFSDGQTYNPWIAYGQSKTANVLMAVSLNEKLGKTGLRAYALNPGSVPSSLQRHFTPETVQLAVDIVKRLGIKHFDRKTPQQGCATTLRAMLDPDLPNDDGVFLHDCNLTTDSSVLAPYAVDRENAEKLWKFSEKIVGQNFDY